MRFIAVTAASLTVAILVAAPSRAASFSARHLSDGHVGFAKKELVAQKIYSATVIRNLSHSWKVAPRHRSCWAHVPWSHICDHARRRLIAHRWLHSIAERRLDRLYPTRPAAPSGFPPHHALWMCISGFEGSPTSVSSSGHYGMLQMHADWGYGTSHHASDDPQSVQEWAAENGWHANGYPSTAFLYGQWFDWDAAAGPCLRYA